LNFFAVPDFRSSTGLFNSLKSQHNLKGSGKHLFDAAVYRDESSTSSFHEMVRSLSKLTKSAKPTPFHHLLARLAHEGRLLRLYTQNVDGIDTSLKPLETQVPLPRKAPWPRTVQLHGGLEKMTCTKCNTLSDFRPELFEGPMPPLCESCEVLDQVRTEVAGKRSHGIGKLRPRMVLYNEHNPDDEAIGAVTRADMRTRPDAIIVVGTSLKVPGVRRIVREMCNIVRDRRDGLAVWINNDPEPSGKEFENCWDLIVRGTCDEVARHAALRKWDDDEIGEWKTVTDEEVKQVAQSSQPQVLVSIQSEPMVFQDNIYKVMPTPLDSPHLAATCTDNAIVKESIEAPTIVGLVRPNPASRGRNLNEVLKKDAGKPSSKQALTKKPSTTKTTKVPKATSITVKKAPAKKPRAPAGKNQAAAANKTITFTTTKPGIDATATKPAISSKLSIITSPKKTSSACQLTQKTNSPAKRLSLNKARDIFSGNANARFPNLRKQQKLGVSGKAPSHAGSLKE